MKLFDHMHVCESRNFQLLCRHITHAKMHLDLIFIQ